MEENWQITGDSPNFTFQILTMSHVVIWNVDLEVVKCISKLSSCDLLDPNVPIIFKMSSAIQLNNCIGPVIVSKLFIIKRVIYTHDNLHIISLTHIHVSNTCSTLIIKNFLWCALQRKQEFAQVFLFQTFTLYGTYTCDCLSKIQPCLLVTWNSFYRPSL